MNRRGPACRLAVCMVTLIAFLSSACSSQARRVDCDGRLEPINQPAPKEKDLGAREPATPAEKRDR